MKWNLENRKLSDLKPFKRNPRTFTKKGMSDLKQSIAEQVKFEKVIPESGFEKLMDMLGVKTCT